MSDLFEEGQSLYEVFGVDRTATAAELKKAYNKLALRLHPDKNPGNEATAQVRMQTLNRVYAVLSDEERRKVYDATGSLEESEVDTAHFRDLYDYYRTMYKKVTEDDIADFEATYRGSPEETRDLLDLFEQFNGNMSKVFAHMLCSREGVDVHRFADILEARLDKKLQTAAFRKWVGEVRKSPPIFTQVAFSATHILPNAVVGACYIQQALLKPQPPPKQDPLKPSSRKPKASGGSTSSDLTALIRARQDHRPSQLDELEARVMAAEEEKKRARQQKRKNAKESSGGKAAKKR